MDTLKVWKDINDQLTRFVLSKVEDRDIANDIVQDVFVKVFTKEDSLRDADKMVAWIYQIARNEVLDHFRKAKIVTLETEVEMVDNPNPSLNSELSQCLHPLMDSLPTIYKEALRMADIEQMSQKEIAQQLNISYSGAKSRVQRGREMLKTNYLQCCNITTDVYGDVLDYEPKHCNEANDCKTNCD